MSRFGQLALEVSLYMPQERLRNERILSQVEAAKSMVKKQFVEKGGGISYKHSAIFLKLSFSLG
jgi:hypothetical protein